MDSNNVLVLVMTTKEYTERQQAVRETWAKDLNYLFYSEENSEDTIKVCEIEDKKEVVLKTKNLIHMIQSRSFKYKGRPIDSFDWIFFVDDDTYVNKNLLDLWLIFLSKRVVHSFLHGNDAKSLHGGAGMLVSLDLIDKVSITDLPSYVRHGDIAMSHYMKNSNIDVSSSPLFSRISPRNVCENCNNYDKITYLSLIHI